MAGPRGASSRVDAVDSSVADRTGLRAEPSRTCVGCRGSDSWSALLRVVAATDEDPGHGPVTLRPDPRHRMPGRGAWLHPTPECFELAVRRKAFGRGLRLQAGVDVSAVARHLGIQQP
ncbi:MAG: YlxR family protein [Terrabacter sp.]